MVFDKTFLPGICFCADYQYIALERKKRRKLFEVIIVLKPIF